MCPFEEKLTAWLLGDLSPGEQQDVTRHLDGCASCRAACEELSRVLTPLRSGLDKDRDLNIPADIVRCGTAARPSRWAWLLHRPHEGLKRAAILALSFGTLFALVSVVHHRPQPASNDPNAVTYISFLRSNEEPAPTLAPATEPKGAASDMPIPAESPAPERIALPAAPVDLPELPAAEQRALSLPRIKDAEVAREVTRKAFAAKGANPESAAAAPAGSIPSFESAPAKAAKRERAKEIPRRMTTDLQTSPLQLAGAAFAATNAIPTNAVPTNAVTPAFKRIP